MHLRSQLVLEQARLLKTYKTEITTEDPKITFGIRAALTREVAEAFGCRELIYAGDVPRCGVATMALEGQEIDCAILLRHTDLTFEAIASSIGSFVAKLEGEGPKLIFQVKITSYAQAFLDFLCRVKVDPVEVVLKPAQMDLGLTSKPAETLSCVDCENEIPIAENDPALHVSGQPCARYVPPPAEEENSGPALVPASLMGGTHQRGTRRQRRAPVQADGPEPEEEADGEPDFMKDLDITAEEEEVGQEA